MVRTAINKLHNSVWICSILFAALKRDSIRVFEMLLLKCLLVFAASF